MRHLALRTSLTALGAAGAIVAILTACGGGGGSSPAPQAAPVAPLPASPNQTVSNFSGPSAPLTVSIKVPSRTEPAASFIANIKKLYGNYRTDKHLRTMANTAATPALRTLGVQVHSNAVKYEQATRRDPTFIPGATYYMEVVVSDAANDTVYVDSMYNGCSTGSCTSTVNAPVGTNMNVTIYLYDDCDFLIAAGTAGGVSVTLGNTTPVTVTINGVVAHFTITSNAQQPFLADPSGAQTFQVSIAAYDWDGDLITTNTNPASVLLDSNFDQITGVNFTVQGGATDITTAQAMPVNVNPADLSFPSFNYSFAGTVPSEGGTEPYLDAAEVAGSQIVPNLNEECCGTSGTDDGIYYMTINATSLNWTNQGGYPVVQGDPTFNSEGGGGNYTYYALEFPLPTNSNTYTFGLTDNSTTFGGNITISDNGNCTGGGGVVSSYSPALGTTAYTLLNGSPYFQITMGSNGATSSCAVYASDGTNTSELDIYTDSTSLTIQSKVRKH